VKIVPHAQQVPCGHGHSSHTHALAQIAFIHSFTTGLEQLRVTREAFDDLSRWASFGRWNYLFRGRSVWMPPNTMRLLDQVGLPTCMMNLKQVLACNNSSGGTSQIMVIRHATKAQYTRLLLRKSFKPRCRNLLSPTFLFLFEGQQPLFPSRITLFLESPFQETSPACWSWRLINLIWSHTRQFVISFFTTVTIHYSFSLSLKAQNSYFPQIPSSIVLLPFHPPDWLHRLQLFFVFIGHLGFNFGTVCLSWLSF